MFDFRWRLLMRRAWWWGSPLWRSSLTWRKPTSANLQCDIYSVSFQAHMHTHTHSWMYACTHTRTEEHVILWCSWISRDVELNKLFRWVEGQWKDDVSLSRSSLLLHTRMAGAACTRWWETHTHTHILTHTKSLTRAAAGVFSVSAVSLLHPVCVPHTAHLWVKNCKELLPSASNGSRFDQPLQATEWLRNFKITNEHFLAKVMGFSVFYLKIL